MADPAVRQPPRPSRRRPDPAAEPEEGPAPKAKARPGPKAKPRPAPPKATGPPPPARGPVLQVDPCLTDFLQQNELGHLQQQLKHAGVVRLSHVLLLDYNLDRLELTDQDRINLEEGRNKKIREMADSESKKAGFPVDRVHPRNQVVQPPSCRTSRGLPYSKSEAERMSLYEAVRSGNVGKVREFLNSGRNLETPIDGELTLLQEVAWFGPAQSVSLCLEARCDPNADSGPDKNTPLHWAVRKGDVEVVGVFLDFYRKRRLGLPELGLDLRDNEGRTALWWAAFHGRTKIATKLVHAKADLNIGNSQGKRPIHEAASRGHMDLVEFLLNQGETDLVRTGKDGRSLVQLAKQTTSYEIAKILERHKEEYPERWLDEASGSESA